MNEKTKRKSVKESRAAALVPRFLRHSDAGFVLGSPQVVKDCEAAGWLKPVERHKKLTLFRFAEVHQCADRIEAGQYPGKPGTAGKEGR